MFYTFEDECSFYKLQYGKDGVENDVSVLDDKGFEMIFPEYFESYLPRRTVSQFEDVFSSLLDCPRRPVPVGPDHQANVPMVSSSRSMVSDRTGDGENEERWMGTCVIPMPVKNLANNGGGRTDCGCLDNGSIRCVRQHVMEAREKLRKTVGRENFMELGFCDMGEEVALRWNEEEEQVFHEVVFLHPASSGQNFWERLYEAFPYRSKRELVSYYFNVFMLRQRAAQNRSSFLYIDSDDDEWHGNHRRSLNEVGTAEEEDDDSGVESLCDQHNNNQPHHEDEPYEDDDDDDDEDEEEEDDDDDDFEEGATKEDNRKTFDPVAQNLDKVQEDDSCMSFECQPNAANPYAPADSQASVQEDETTITQKNSSPDDNGEPGYLLEPSETKAWDARYWTGSINGVDLLPTCNMIEEIFGLGTPNSKTKDKALP